MPMQPTLRALAAAVALSLAGHALAAPLAIDLPAQPLAASLRQLGEAAGLTIAVDSSLVQGLQAPAVSGRLEPLEALSRLLSGSGLSYQQSGNTLVISRPSGDTMELGVTSINGVAPGAVTEGTGSYTSGSTSTATKLPLSIRETPQSISVMTRQRMDDQGLTQLLDVARQTPGLSINQSGNAGSDSSSIYSRGFAVENYQVDGEQRLDSNYNSIFQTSDMVIYDRVEILRGATGLLNGIGTPGATINLIRKRPTADLRSSVMFQGGSWDHYRGELDVGGPLNDEGTLRARVVGAYQENDSYIDRLHERKQVLYGIVEADLGADTLLTVGMDAQYHDADDHARSGRPLFNQDGSLADWSRSDSAAAAWAYSERHFVSAFASLEQRLNDDWSAKLSLSQGRFEYDEVIGYAAGGAPDPATGAGVSLWAGRWEAKPVQTGLDLSTTGAFDLFGQRHDAVIGYSRQHTQYRTTGYNLWWHDDWDSSVPNIYTWNGKDPARPDIKAVSRLDFDEEQSGAYASTRLRATDDLSLILGGRVSDWENTRKNDNFDPSLEDTVDKRSESGVFTPYAGVVYDIDEHWSVYASYTTIFKPQSAQTVTGSYLDPLEGKGYEVGGKAAFFDDQLNLGLALYQIEQDNLAVSIPGEFAPDGSQAYRAESGTKTRGFELELSGELAPGWQAMASFSRNLVQDADGNKLNTDIPQNTFKLFTTYELRGIGNGLTVGGGVNWQSEIYSNDMGPNRVRFTQDDYAVVDLMARYPITHQLSATLNLNNLLDEEYYTSTSSSYQGAPRNATLGLKYDF
ncbi:TonB-dependent siderophore receptor [Zestomonas carbonaria]|uniref:Ferric-pseudobactin BN7/BN8 receptor n=1 Tax=Zestomonas carbonaria TaxID=2762745 RepID=A0A7U7ELJ1_9GAMM|nr:TonB-dependent siderophore receptor [Pseudomonas carbonaria]CAD5107253.1 Ferric-pseudobactin BN7/BN8 receptor [Pseudomonas carbonaria]